MQNIYHYNGMIAWNGKRAYHDQGQIAWSERSSYYSDGKIAFRNGRGYHRSGIIAWDGSRAYDADGSILQQNWIRLTLGTDIFLTLSKSKTELNVVGVDVLNSN